MRTFTVIILLLAAAVASAGQGPAGGKDLRTAAQRKIDSQLLQEINRSKTEPSTDVKIDRKRRALVDVRVEVTPAIQKSIRGLGGAIVSASAEYRSVVAWVPLAKLEALAADQSVHAIIPAQQAVIHR